MSKPWIQVSIDTQDIPSARAHIDHALAIDAEWIEVGTPLLTFAGIESISSVKEIVQHRSVVADFKALDGVEQYFLRAGELGASVATVMAVANEASILKAIEAGHAAGVEIQVDMLGIPQEDLSSRARDIAAMGADYFLHHLAIDELLRNPTADPLLGLEELVRASDVPVGPVVFSDVQGVEAIRRGAQYVVIGYPYLTMDNARALMVGFADAVRATELV